MGSKAVRGSINFNSKHLAKGDPLPPFTGKLRVYNMRYCPFAQRAILALNAKNIDYELFNINLMDKPEWFTDKSRFGKVPAIEVEENVSICESLVIAEYLDEAYPERPLLPKDPLRKAQDKLVVEGGKLLMGLFVQVMTGKEITDDAVKTYHKALEFIQEQLKTRGTKFLYGDQPGYADYMIWPIFERILAFVEVEPKLEIDEENYELLSQYLKDMQQDPVVSDYYVPKEIGRNFLAGYKKTPPYHDYSILKALAD